MDGTVDCRWLLPCSPVHSPDAAALPSQVSKARDRMETGQDQLDSKIQDQLDPKVVDQLDPKVLDQLDPRMPIRTDRTPLFFWPVSIRR